MHRCSFPHTRHRLTAVGLLFLLVLPLLILLSAASCRAAISRSFVPLTEPPRGERWFGMFFNDKRAGVVRVTVSPTPTGSLLETVSVVKMSGFGFSRDAALRERYVVGRDLSLQSFEVAQTIDGIAVTLTGQVTGKVIALTTESKGTRTEKTIPIAGRVYPPSILNFYPLFQSVTAGRRHRLTVFDPEALAVKQLRVTVVGFETLAGVPAVHLRNDLYPFVSNDIWVDYQGNTLLESVRDGWIATRVEDAAAARADFVAAALAREDLLREFSLVPVDRPIERPAALSALTLELSGVAGTVPLLTDQVQQVTRQPDSTTVQVTVDNRLLPASGTLNAALPELQPYLAASERILSDHPEIIRYKAAILGETTEPRLVVTQLARWVADYLEDATTGNQSLLEILEKRSGTSLCHARLYTALARAAGIPTRIVSGLVYVEGHGFRYHSWAESYVGYWLPVDPANSEVPANASHIKVVEGDAPADLAVLADSIGAIRARVVDLKYLNTD